MTLGTKIEWADATFSPWRGCTKVSPACDHCYAEAYGKRFGIAWGPGAKRVLASEAYWRQPLKWDAKAKAAGKPLRVFCASLADVFDAEIPDSWRDGLFELIDRTPNLIWMLLTKRSKVALDYLGDIAPRPNVWIGTTVENQAMAELRIPLLLKIPAAKRFVSCEPLLGPVDLTPWLRPDPEGTGPSKRVVLDWVIAGSESGHGARRCDLAWVRDLRDQCSAMDIAFFWKQDADIRGRKIPTPELDGKRWVELPR